MPASANAKQRWQMLLCAAGLWLSCSHAGAYGVGIVEAGLRAEKQWYVLSADIDYRLSPVAKKALRSGIPLLWTIQVGIYRERPYLWDKKVHYRKNLYRIRYHPLMNVYQVKDQGKGSVENFLTLAGALGALGRVRDMHIVEIRRLDPRHSYYAAIKVSFDREALPLPLRPVAYVNADWSLSSDWYRCPIKK